MSVRLRLGDQHEVISREPLCSGYIDNLGKWNSGFNCPRFEQQIPVFCCGSSSLHYCCITEQQRGVTEPQQETSPPPNPHHHNQHFSVDAFFTQNWPLLAGVVAGVVATVALLCVTAVWLCRSRSRPASCRHNDKLTDGSDSYYAAPSTVSGVTSIYGTSSSLSRSATGTHVSLPARRDIEDRLPEVDEVAVRFPSVTSYQVNDLSAASTLPRTFSKFYNDKHGSVMMETVDSTSMSTSSDNERQILADHTPFPPAMRPLLPPTSSVVNMRHSSYKLEPLACMQHHFATPHAGGTLAMPDIEAVLRRVEGSVGCDVTTTVGAGDNTSSIVQPPANFCSSSQHADSLGFCQATSM